MVCGNAIHHARLFSHAAKEIAPADDDGDFDAKIPNG